MNLAVDSEGREMMSNFIVQRQMFMDIPAFPSTFLTTLEERLKDRKEAPQPGDYAMARSSGTLEAVPVLDRDMTRLQIKINRLLLEMKSLRPRASDSALAPVNRLPPEVLTQIFVSMLPERVFPRRVSSPLCLSHVCSGWRDTALNYSRLWNVLSIDVLRHSRPRLLSVMITTWFRRANNPLPLSLSLANHISYGRAAEDIILSIIPLLPRFSELRFEMVNLQSLVPILSLSGGRVPSLETLVLNVQEAYPDSSPPINLFGTAPNLRTVTFGIPSPIFADGLACLFPWKQLTCIDIQQGITVDAFATIIFSCMYLQTASFLLRSRDDSEWTDDPDLPGQDVKFSALAILKIKLSDHFDQPSSLADVLDRFHLPAIRTLLLESSPFGLEFPLYAIHRQRRDRLGPIRTLKAFSLYNTQQELFELIHACPLLETLGLQLPYEDSRTFLQDVRMAVDDTDHPLPLSHLTCFELRLVATDAIQSVIADLTLLVLSLAKVCRLKTVSIIITDFGDKEDVTRSLSVALYDLRRSLERLIHPRPWNQRTEGVELTTKVLIGARGP